MFQILNLDFFFFKISVFKFSLIFYRLLSDLVHFLSKFCKGIFLFKKERMLWKFELRWKKLLGDSLGWYIFLTKVGLLFSVFVAEKVVLIKIFLILITFLELLSKDEDLYVILRRDWLSFFFRPFDGTLRNRIKKLIPKLNSVTAKTSK